MHPRTTPPGFASNPDGGRRRARTNLTGCEARAEGSDEPIKRSGPRSTCQLYEPNPPAPDTLLYTCVALATSSTGLQPSRPCGKRAATGLLKQLGSGGSGRNPTAHPHRLSTTCQCTRRPIARCRPPVLGFGCGGGWHTAARRPAWDTPVQSNPRTRAASTATARRERSDWFPLLQARTHRRRPPPTRRGLALPAAY